MHLCYPGGGQAKPLWVAPGRRLYTHPPSSPLVGTCPGPCLCPHILQYAERTLKFGHHALLLCPMHPFNPGGGHANLSGSPLGGVYTPATAPPPKSYPWEEYILGISRIDIKFFEMFFFFCFIGEAKISVKFSKTNYSLKIVNFNIIELTK